MSSDRDKKSRTGRRPFLAVTASMVALSGCSGDDSTGSPDSEEQTNDTDEEGQDQQQNEQEEDQNEESDQEDDPKPPDFNVEIIAPETVKTREEWGYEIEVSNTGGTGEFSSTISIGTESEENINTEEISTEIEAGETEVVRESSGLFSPAPVTIEIQSSQPMETTVVDIEWADVYDPDTIRDRAESPTYEELFRDFESYSGEAIRFEYGYVYQTLYDQSPNQFIDLDYFQMSVANNEEQVEGDIAADWYGDDRLLEDDIIELWGVAEELISYETVQGDTRTIPLITLTDYRLRE